MIILGIDPGTAITGYGVIRAVSRKSGEKEIRCLDFGCIRTSPAELPEERLKKIYNEINKLITKHKPKILAIESLYFFKNLKTAMPVSQAKGVIILAAAKKKLPIYEITPLEVKMTITGYGRASKKQTQRMVENILKIKEKLRPDDVADALGVAICGALKYNNDKRFNLNR